MKKLIVAISLSLLLVFSLFTYGKITAKEISLEGIDLTKVSDGVYYGSYEKGPVSARVKLVIQNHKVVVASLIDHDTALGQKAEAVLQELVKAQTTQIDAISGATLSSKVLLKASEMALQSP